MMGLIFAISDGFKAAMFRPINKSANVILGVTSIIWGLWVANPFWKAFDSAKVFSILDYLGPEWVWGAIPIVIGLMMVIGMAKDKFSLTLNGTRAGFYWWLFAAICFFIGDWQNTAGVIYTMVALYSGYVALNLSTNRQYFLEK